MYKVKPLTQGKNSIAFCYEDRISKKWNKKMAVVEGFEPSTPGSEDQCSIQLSYTTV